MDKLLQPRLNKYSKEHDEKQKWLITASVLCALVALVTSYVLINPAITKEEVTYCGFEEHAEHTDECYAPVSASSDGAGTEVTEGTEGIEGTEGTEEEIGEENAAEGEKVLVCQKPIHVHTLQCFSDPGADIEDNAEWVKTADKATLIGNRNTDVLSVAETQLGYAESTRNYLVLEDGESVRGYTRYGDLYGDRYAEWDALLCAFCLSRAGAEEGFVPEVKTATAWVEYLRSEDVDRFRDFGTYLPVPGDLVFFDSNPEDALIADHMGFVKEILFDSVTKEPCGFRSIEGDLNGSVGIGNHDIYENNILGYGVLPQNPEWFTLGTVTETGVVVTVSGLGSSLPVPMQDVTLSAFEIASNESAELLASKLAEDGGCDRDTLLMDISLLCGEETIEPVGPVYLSFVSEDVDVDTSVYHIDEESGTVTDMQAEVNPDEGSVILETEHFSVYGLTLNPKAGKNVSAEVEADWTPGAGGAAGTLSSVKIYAHSTAGNIFYNYDVGVGDSWTIGAGSWSAKTNAGVTVELDITSAVNSNPLSTHYRVRVAENTTAPDNDKSGTSQEFSLYDILDAAKPGFSDWVSGAYAELFGGTRPTNAGALFTAFDMYYSLPSLTLSSEMVPDGEGNSILLVTADTEAAFVPGYVWQFYDNEAGWITLEDETGSTLNATTYSSLTPDAEYILDGGKTVRCLLYDGGVLKASATLKNVNPLKEVYDDAIAHINSELGLTEYSWYLRGGGKNGGGSVTVYETDVSIGSTRFNDYFYYDNVARDPKVPFSDAESYANYLASEYLRVKDEKGEEEALAHVADIWDRYIFDIYNPNNDAGVLEHKTYYPGANGDGPISTYGDNIIEWPKDNACSFHTPISGVDRNGEGGLIQSLEYDFLEDGVDYSRFIQSLNKTATADEPGDFNTERTYDVDIVAETQASSVSPLAMLITVQTSWQMFDMAHANCVKGDGTYTSIEVGAAQHNTEMANLYDIKQAILHFVDWMEENFPGRNLVLGVNEIQHGGSFNLIEYNCGTVNGKTNTVYVSNNSEILHEALYDWDSFGNCEHVHYANNDTAMKNAAAALYDNLTGWVDLKGDPIRFEDINKIAVVIGGGTENSSDTQGYGCLVPWGSFYDSSIDAVYGIRTNVGTSLNTAGVLSWLDYSKNNTGKPYSLDPSAGYSDSSAEGRFTEKYVATTEDAIFNYLVKIAQKALKTKGIKDYDEGKSIDAVTVCDTVSDEFRIEPNKPFTATVVNRNGTVSHQTVVTPLTYTSDGRIATASVTYTVYNSDGTVNTTSTSVENATYDGGVTYISKSVTLPGCSAPYLQTLTVCEKSDHTTDVSFDFGTVFNTHNAKLHFEVVARDDYIGSNNVFTNVNVPTVSFMHIKLNKDGSIYIDPNTNQQVIVSDTTEGNDTPEVNVPIRFDVNNGGKVTVEVKTPVNLENLKTSEGAVMSEDSPTAADSEYITAVVHDLIDNYDQINGTVSYVWEIPGGKQYPVPTTLHVTDGVPDSSITNASEMAQQWTPKTPGTYDVILKVIFTPDPVSESGNFADEITATRVTALEKQGHETVKVNPKSGGPAGAVTELTVMKEWSGEKGTTSNRPAGITFNVFQNGEFYDQQTVSAANGWKHTFTELPYSNPDDASDIYKYTVTEDPVPGYMTEYGALQTVPAPVYWVEVPLTKLKLDGSTEYMIVDKTSGYALCTDGVDKILEVDLHLAGDEDETFPDAVDEEAASYFTDDEYCGWTILYSGDNNNANNYLEVAAEDDEDDEEDDEEDESHSYLKKDGTLATEKGNDTCLKADPKSNGKIKLNDKYLIVKFDKGAYTFTNDGDVNKATEFAFYEKVLDPAPPTFRTTVTNTFLPGGERPNETSVSVSKTWVGTDTTAPVTIELYRDGEYLTECVLDSSCDWQHTFLTLPDSDEPLPYINPLTGDPYEYTVKERKILGFETGYNFVAVPDAGGGQHYIPFNESSVPGSTTLWDSTSYVLVTTFANLSGQYMIGFSNGALTYSPATVRIADDPSTTGVVETFEFGTLSCSKELTGTIPPEVLLTAEPHHDPKNQASFLLEMNGYYLALKKDNKNFDYASTPTDANPNCNWQFGYNSTTGTGYFYVLSGDKYDTPKYLTLKMENKKGKYVMTPGFDGNVNNAAKFSVFEKVSLQSKYDTYTCDVQNISTDEPSTDGKVDCRKYIDYLADNIEDTPTSNPDTGLSGDYYRLYLDAVGTREDGSIGYPEFKGVYVTDYLSKYVKLVGGGSNMSLTINKISRTNPEDITYLWYGNYIPQTSSVGSATEAGRNVIESVTYSNADDDEESNGMIRVDFMPDYCLEEGYRYVISYNVEASELAKESMSYPADSFGDPDTDYPGNSTSSGQPGFRANSFADVVYTQDGDVKIAIYDHPVIQLLFTYKLPETGGIGTVPFFAFGGVLAIGSAWILLRKKRKKDRV